MKQKSLKRNIPKIEQQYSGLLCCNLLSVIENEYVHECVLDYDEANSSNFQVFVDTIQDNSNELCNAEAKKTAFSSGFSKYFDAYARCSAAYTISL